MLRNWIVLLMLLADLKSGGATLPPPTPASGDYSVQPYFSSEFHPKDSRWFATPWSATDPNWRYQMSPQTPLWLTQQASASWPTINVNSSTTYQTVLGMGTSLEETSIYALSKNHNDAQTEQALSDLIDPVNGIGMNLFRICIGTSDFSDGTSVTNDPTNNPHGWYTYQDGGPTAPFSIQYDIDLNIVHTILLAEDVATKTNHPIKIFASAWSPPAWMKDSNSLSGGNLLTSMIPAYATYLREFVQAYQAQGIPIYAITTGNEHYFSTTNYPSCYFTPQQETTLVEAIATEFAKYGITTKVWILDHNYAYYNQVDQTLAGLGTNLGEVDSVAYHHYAGDPSNMSVSHNAYPSVGTQFTEGSVWGTAGANEIVQDFRNWSSSYVSWVTMTTQTPSQIQGPYNGPPALSPTLMIRNNNTETGTDPDPDYYKIPEYYLYGQFMKFIQPGAVRISSDAGSTSQTTNVAFKNPDGTIVIVAVNQNNWDQDVRFVVDGNQFNAAIPAATVATYVLKGGLAASTVAPVGLPVLPNPISPPTGSGSFVQEWFLNLSGVTSSNLQNNPGFSVNPSGASVLTTLHTNDQWTVASGTRMTGCIVPNVTGAYTFYFQANSIGEFRLSTDSTAAHLPSSPTAYCYVYAVDWTSRPGQISAPVNLVAGQKYYFETLQAGGGGNGESGVAWDIPGIDNGQVITGKFLSPSMEAIAPSVTSPLTASATTQVAFNYQITGTNTPVAYSASGLPAGLTLNTSSGAITGMPTTTGTSKATIGVLNVAGQGTATLTITVAANALAPAFTSPTTASGVEGTAFNYAVTATNSPTGFAASGLPKGLSINTTTGVISGTPTTAGSSNVTLSATNAYGTVTQTLTVTITAISAPVITSATSASGVAGTAFSYTIMASNTPTSFNATGLPAGLSVNTTTGVISGTPTAAGTASVSLSATNAGGTGTATLALTINPPPPSITSAASDTATQGSPYSYTITATNSPTSYGATGLPAGLSVNTSTGVISGTPTVTGTYPVALSATNAGGTGTSSLSLQITAPGTLALTWSGSVSTAWDTVTANWLSGTTASPYADGDAVTFDDTGSGGTVVVNGTRTPGSVTVNTSSKSYSLNGPGLLTGPMTLTKSGSSTLSLSGANTYTGGTVLLAGEINFSSSATALGTGTLTLGAAGDTSTLVIRANSVNPPNAIVVNAGGTRWLEPGNGAAIKYTGPITLNGGATLGFSTIGGNITASGGVTGTGNILLGENGGARANSETLSGGDINNAGTISDSGNPDTGGAFVSANIGSNVTGITQNSATESMTLSGVNLFNGPITIGSGTLTVSGAGVLGGGVHTAAISNNGTLNYNSTAAQTLSGAISGTGTLTESGTGFLTLAGANTYTGPTNVNSGVLFVNGSVTSPVSVAGGATLGGAGTITGNVTAASGSELTFNLTSSGVTGLTINGNLALNGTINVTPTILSGSVTPGTYTIATYSGALSGSPVFVWLPPQGSTLTTSFDTSTPGVIKLIVNPPPPVISSAASDTATQGSPYSYTITASNSPTSFNATGLPAGLSINTTTGVISGTPTAAGTASVSLSATNAGGTGTATLALTVNPPPPTITSAASATGIIGTSFNYTITGSSSPTSYNATGLPAGLSVDTGTGVISGTLSALGTTVINLSATNPYGTGTGTLALTVNPPAPVISSAASDTATQGSPYSYTITASNSPTSFNATGLPAGLSVNTTTGVISGTPTAVGTSTVNLSATNVSGTGVATLTLTVNPPPPVISSAPTATGTTGVAFSYTITASNTPTSFNATGLPAGLSINTITGVISGTPTAAGTSSVSLSATNAGGTGTATLALTVNPPPPVISSAPTATGTTGLAFSYTITASNSPTSFNATGLPAGLSVNTTTGVISGTPTAVGTSSVALSATNAGGTGTATLTLTVNPPPPVISSAVTATGTQGSAFSYTITASNSPTSFNATGLPAGLSVNTTTGVISGTPTAIGTSSVALSATNAGGMGTATLTLTVNPPAPVISSAPTATGTQGSAFSYTITASNTPTSFNATGLPAGLSVNTTTGVISGTPTAAGTASVSLSATNAGGTGTATLALTINPPPPVISSAASDTATQGSPYSYTITASNSPTSFNATGLPAGLSVNTTTGVISGTPTAAGTASVSLSATNAGGTGTATLALTINPAPPVISSAATATGTAGVPFTYTITASNTPTSFNATGLPAGLSVNTTTGVISGTPTAAGTASVSLSATNAGGTGTATLALTINPPSATTLTWSGAVNTTWDTSTLNWLNGSTAAAYFDGNTVVANDSAVTGTITLAGTYSPASVTINTSVKSYSLSGPGKLAGPMTLTKSGSTALGLSSANSYTGGTMLLGGQLSLSGSSAVLGTGPLIFGSPSDSSTLTVRANSINLANPITVYAGGTRWIEPGNGNAVTYTGPVTLNGGVTLTLSTVGGNLTLSGGITGTGNILLGENGGSRKSSETLSGAAVNNIGTISDAGNPDTGGAVISAPIGTNVTGITQGSTSESLTLTGTSTFNGPITISSGTLTLGGTGVLGSGTYSGTIANSGALVFNSSTDQTLSGVISGAGTFTDSGTGILMLTGNDTYSGATSVASGAALLVDQSLNSAVTVNAGGALGGSGTIHNNITINSGAELSFNVTSGGVAGLTIQGNIAASGTVNITPTILSGSLSSGTYTITTYTGTLTGSPTFQWLPPEGSSQTATISTATAGKITITVP